MSLHRRTHPVPVDGCFGCHAATLVLAVRADDAYHRSLDYVVDVDRPAYARLRRHGLQPPRINGCAELEATAQTEWEITKGQVYRDQRQLKDALTLCADSGFDPTCPAATPWGGDG